MLAVRKGHGSLLDQVQALPFSEALCFPVHLLGTGRDLGPVPSCVCAQREQEGLPSSLDNVHEGPVHHDALLLLREAPPGLQVPQEDPPPPSLLPLFASRHLQVTTEPPPGLVHRQHLGPEDWPGAGQCCHVVGVAASQDHLQDLRGKQREAVDGRDRGGRAIFLVLQSRPLPVGLALHLSGFC